MPEDGVELQPKDRLLSRQEIKSLASLFVEAGSSGASSNCTIKPGLGYTERKLKTSNSCTGVDKIRLTGGEPTLRRDLLGIIGDLSTLPGVKQVQTYLYR